MFVVEGTANNANVGIARGKVLRDVAQKCGDAVFRMALSQSVQNSATNVARAGSSEKVRSTMKFHQRIERLECFGFPYIKILAPILLARYAR